MQQERDAEQRWAAEKDAYRELVGLYEKALNVKRCFERAGLSLPEPLQRFLMVTVQVTESDPAPTAT